MNPVHPKEFRVGEWLKFKSLIYTGTPDQDSSNPASEATSGTGPNEAASNTFKTATDQGKTKERAEKLAYVPSRPSSLFRPGHPTKIS